MSDQARDYAQGRTTPGAIITNAQPGQSPHNFGLAVDVTLISGAVDDWDYHHVSWQTMIWTVRASRTLHSGADFHTLADYPHIELVGWRKAAIFDRTIAAT